MDNDMIRQQHDKNFFYHVFGAHMIKKMISLFYFIMCLVQLVINMIPSAPSLFHHNKFIVFEHRRRTSIFDRMKHLTPKVLTPLTMKPPPLA